MAKAVKGKITWTPSPSADVAKQVIQITTDGNLLETELIPGAAEFEAQFNASSVAMVDIKTVDTEGKEATSVVLTITVGDLVDPLPATDLAWTPTEVVDVEEPTT
jgi:hypothetical protein